MSADLRSAGLERTLAREYYLSPEVLGREKERIFCREWFCVGREEELAAPGDYVVKDVAGESILVVRTRNGGLAAHYNVCRHRGSQLVRDGCARRFPGGIRCRYHSWTYTLEGELRTAPFLDPLPQSGQAAPPSALPKGELSLHPVGAWSSPTAPTGPRSSPSFCSTPRRWPGQISTPPTPWRSEK